MTNRQLYNAVIEAIKNNIASVFVLLGFSVGTAIIALNVDWLRVPFLVTSAVLVLIALLIAFKMVRKQHIFLTQMRKQLRNTVPPYKTTYAVNISFIILALSIAAGIGLYFYGQICA